MSDLLIPLNLLFAGLLAGEELAVCYGVRRPLGALAAMPQTQMRHGLAQRLRLLVPALFAPTLVTAAILAARGPTLPHLLAVGALLVWAAVTFAGTVPINKAALDWAPEAPPSEWRYVVARWEMLDIVRCWAALMAYAALLLANWAPL